MDNKILKEFIRTTKPNYLRKYAEMITAMLTKEQMVTLESFFEVKLTIKPLEEKAPEEPVIEPEPKPEPISKATPDFIRKPKAMVRPKPPIEPDPFSAEEEEEGDSTSAEEILEKPIENLFDESALTKEDIEKMKKTLDDTEIDRI